MKFFMRSFLKVAICVFPFFLLMASPAYKEYGSIGAVIFFASLPTLFLAFLIAGEMSTQDYIKWAEEENTKVKGAQE